MRNKVDCRWDVAALTSMAGFFAIATNRNVGWFYVVFMEEFGIDRRGAAWPGSVLGVTLRCSGLVVSVLQKHVPLYWMGLVGSVLLWSSLIVCAFVPNVEWMTVMMGFAHGLGSGMLLVVNLVLIMQYFNKYRGIAAGLRLSANPVSAIVFPMVLSTLKDVYGFRGTMLVYAAITMHVTAFSIMLKEPPWIRRKRTKQETSAKEVSSDNLNRLTDVRAECDNSQLNKQIESANYSGVNQICLEKANECELLVQEAEALLPNVKQPKSNVSSSKTSPRLVRSSSIPNFEIDTHRDNKTASELEIKKLGCHVPLLNTDKQVLEKLNSEVTSGDHIAQRLVQEISRRISSASSLTMRSLESNSKSGELYKSVKDGEKEQQRTRNSTCRDRFTHLSGRLVRWLAKCVRLPSLGLFLAVVGSMLLDYINLVHLSTLVDYARDKGVSHTQATLTIVYAAGPEIFGRVLLPFIADLGWVTRPTLACSSLFSLGLLFATTPETTGAAHIVLRALSSVAMAGLLTMKQVLIADNLGANAVALVSGASGLLLVPVLLSNPLIIGYFRDTTGSYDNLFRIAAGVILFSGFVFLGIMISSRRTNATTEDKSDTGCAA